MKNSFFRRPRPLYFSLIAITFLCLVLLVLYGLAEKENKMLKESRGELFLSLAMGEAEAAEVAWQEDRPIPELYHHITSAAEYLSMTTQTDKVRETTKRLRKMGNDLLELAETEQGTQALTTYPWQELSTISRDEGKKKAEAITQTQNCLRAACGREYIYTCKNVYVKLSKGGVPMEIAVYTPAREDRPYTEADCVLRSQRFLQNALPRKLSHKDATAITPTETGYRIWYPCGTGRVWVDVRGDTGRIVGLQFVPAITS